MRNNRSTNWKRALTALSLTGSTLLISLPASAQNIRVLVDGNTVNFAGVPPTSQGGRVLVPLRGIFEALGAVVDYDNATRTIEALRGETRLRLTLGSTTAYVNDRPIQLDVPAQTSLGRTLVPLRFVGQAFGAQVNWNNADRSVIITSPLDTGTTPIPVPTPRPTPAPIPNPIPEPDPTGEPADARTASGTVVSVTPGQPGRITIRTRNLEQTFTVQRNAVVERRPLLNRSTPANPEYGTTTTINFADVRVGEMVELSYNDNNRVTRVVAMPSVSVARVLSATGNRIVLDDGRETPFTIGANLRFVNAQGREATTTTLRRGDEVVVFIAPDTRRVYQISSSRADLNAAYGRDVEDEFLPPAGDDDDDDDETPVNNTDRATIELVTFTTNNKDGVASKVGDVLTVTVRGTPGLRGSFDVSQRATNIPLRERPQRPGTYFGTYTIKAGDDVTDGRATVRLVGRNGEEITQQSLDELTIDTEAPTVIGTKPLASATVNNRRPNIVIYAEELGSGLADSTLTITNNGNTFDVPATASQANSISAVPQRDLSGRVNVRAVISDEAGNTTTHNFSFTVRGGNGGGNTGGGNNGGNNIDNDGDTITSIFHNGNQVLEAGERLVVDMIATSGGRASFDLVNEDDRVVARDVAMTEVQRERGRYRGEYTVQGVRDAGELRVIGRFRDADGQTTTSEATTTIEVVGGETDQGAPTISFPTEGDTVENQITIRGRGIAGSIVQVSVRAEGTQYFVVPYSVEVTAPTARVRNNGTWETAPITLPRPRNVSGLRYIISATQTDNADRESEATTVTVRPAQ